MPKQTIKIELWYDSDKKPIAAIRRAIERTLIDMHDVKDFEIVSLRGKTNNSKNKK